MYYVESGTKITLVLIILTSLKSDQCSIKWWIIQSAQKQASSQEKDLAKRPTLRHTLTKYRHHQLGNCSSRREKSAPSFKQKNYISLQKINHDRSDQPFCCLKDWIEPEWCTMAALGCSPAYLIKFPVRKS